MLAVLNFISISFIVGGELSTVLSKVATILPNKSLVEQDIQRVFTIGTILNTFLQPFSKNVFLTFLRDIFKFLKQKSY